jgi:hypothetical protein
MQLDELLIVSKIIFTTEEIKTISKFITDNESKIKDLVKSNSLTNAFKSYNFLNSEIGDLLKQKILKFLKEQKVEKPLYIQCWSNVFRKNEGIGLHKHADDLDEFLCANIFIDGDENIGTTYIINNKPFNIKNTKGEITLFNSQIPHYVERNKTNNTRISIAMDIHQNKKTATEIDNKLRYYHYV